jgi:hypothetical protein
MGDGSSAKVDNADTGSRSRRRRAASEKLPTRINCRYMYHSFLQQLVEHNAADRADCITMGGIDIWDTVYLADSIWGTFGVQIKIPNFFPLNRSNVISWVADWILVIEPRISCQKRKQWRSLSVNTAIVLGAVSHVHVENASYLNCPNAFTVRAPLFLTAYVRRRGHANVISLPI